MRRLYLELLCLAIGFSLIVVFLEARYSSYRNKADRMMERFFDSADKTEILLCGNSHMIAVYNELRRMNVSNVSLLGLEGIDIFQQRNLLIRYAGKMKRLKLLIVNADEYSMGNNLKVSNFSFADRMLFPYTDTLYEDNISSRLASRSHFLRSNRDLSFLFKGQPEASDWKTAEPSINFAEGKTCINRSKELTERRYDKRLYGENMESFAELLDFASKLDAKVVVLSLPLSHCYNQHKNFLHADEGASMISRIAEDSGVPYYNLTYVDSIGDEYFRDTDHLNREGVQKLVSLLDTLFRDEGIMPDFQGKLLSK